MLEYYHIFAKKIKLLPPDPELSYFYHPSENKQKMVLVVMGTGIVTYFLCKYLK